MLKKIILVCFSIVCLSACENDHYYDKTFRELIEGSYRIGSYNESITFESNGSFWMESDDNEYIDDCYGDYHVDEKDQNNIICTYEDPEDYETYTDTMRLINRIGSNNTLQVKNVPMHRDGSVIILTRK